MISGIAFSAAACVIVFLLVWKGAKASAGKDKFNVTVGNGDNEIKDIESLVGVLHKMTESVSLLTTRVDNLAQIQSLTKVQLANIDSIIMGLQVMNDNYPLSQRVRIYKEYRDKGYNGVVELFYNQAIEPLLPTLFGRRATDKVTEESPKETT
jgi:hypothetical protein